MLNLHAEFVARNGHEPSLCLECDIPHPKLHGMVPGFIVYRVRNGEPRKPVFSGVDSDAFGYVREHHGDLASDESFVMEWPRCYHHKTMAVARGWAS